MKETSFCFLLDGGIDTKAERWKLVMAPLLIRSIGI